MTRRRLVRPTGLLAEHAAMETERDDALLRAERAEIERDEAVAELAELRKYVAAEREFGTKMIRHTEKLQDERDELKRKLNDCPSCDRDLSYPGAPGHECSRSKP